eukprot:gene10806-biopygen6801
METSDTGTTWRRLTRKRHGDVWHGSDMETSVTGTTRRRPARERPLSQDLVSSSCYPTSPLFAGGGGAGGKPAQGEGRAPALVLLDEPGVHPVLLVEHRDAQRGVPERVLPPQQEPLRLARPSRAGQGPVPMVFNNWNPNQIQPRNYFSQMTLDDYEKSCFGAADPSLHRKSLRNAQDLPAT